MFLKSTSATIRRMFLSSIFLLMASVAFAEAPVTISFEYSSPSPLTMNIGDSAWVRFDATFSSSAFDTLFLHIPDKPDFFIFWRERKFTGPANYIYDKIVFKPKATDGGHYIIPIVAGGIRANGEVVADTLYYDLRVKPFIFHEPEFSGGTSNIIEWMKCDYLYDQWIYLIDPTQATTFGKPLGLAKSSSIEIIQTTFENLQHDVNYGFFIKGFTADSSIVYSDTVYSTQDSYPPDFLNTSWGKEGPNGTIDLHWRSVSDQLSYIKGYVIYRRTEGAGYILKDSVLVKSNSANDTFHFQDNQQCGLIEGTRYFYKIVAFDAGGNLGDGQEIGPFIPDATPPQPPIFMWAIGHGYDYVLDHPINDLPNMDYTEKTWFKRGTQNTVYIFNPSFLSGFEGLAKADSVRFQAVRDSSKFFADEWQPGMQFFDKWVSPWISIDDFIDSLLSYNFDFTNHGRNDDWFVHNHFYKYRSQFKDNAGNLSDWSRRNTEDLLVGAYQDNFPPGDISNLNLLLMFDSTFDGGGYFRLEWQKANDPVSDVNHYNIYRKVGTDGEFVLRTSIAAAGLDIFHFFDPFGTIDRRAKIFYRVTAIDNVGNEHDLQMTNWEVQDWAPLPPKIKFEAQHTLINAQLFTTQSTAGVDWNSFDTEGVVQMIVHVNVDSQSIDPIEKRWDVPLREGENQIFARVLFDNGVWSPKSNVLTLFKDSTPPTPITNLQVEKDTLFTGNISLSWAVSQDQLAVTYEVFRQEKGASNFQLLGTTGSTSWFDPYINPNGGNLKAFQRYVYKIYPKDVLSNTAEQSAGVGETYCNLAPKIERFSFQEDSLAVFWHFVAYPDSNSVPLNLLRFDVKLFRDALPQDITSAPAYRVDYVVGNTHFHFKVDPGPRYFAVVRAVELKSTLLDSSAWSPARFSDTGLSIIPPNDTLFTQDQPLESNGIYVSWENYWNQSFWLDHAKGIVGYVKVLRWQKSNPTQQLARIFAPQSPEFLQSGFIDKQALAANEHYVYQIIPYEVKVNDPPRYLPAGNSEAAILNDTSSITNYIDRGFIPKIDYGSAINPATGKRYFHFLSAADSMRMTWFWLYQKDGNEITAAKGDLRGAQRLRLVLANNPEFALQPTVKKYVKTVELERSLLANDDQFYYTYIKDLMNPNTFNIYEGKSLYVKIMGFDRWGHDPAYPSSLELDGLTEFVMDNTPPTDPKLSFQIRSSADTLFTVPLVDIQFSWKKSVDAISGLRDYAIEIYDKNHPDSLIYQTTAIPPTDTTFVLRQFEIKDEYFLSPLNFKISPRDYAGNINQNTQEIEFKFFTPPKVLDVVRDTLTNKIRFTWTKVQSADKYLIVFATQKSYFMDENLRYNPGSREEVIALPTHPDTIQKVLSRYYNPDSTWYFRMTALKSDIYEAGWSNIFMLPASQNSGSGNPISNIDKDVELPLSYQLNQNYPNPFNPETMIEYTIPHHTELEIVVFNLRGEKVRTLVAGEQLQGSYQVKWNGRDDQNEQVASGVYLYVITTPDFRQVKKCLLLK